MTEYDIAFGRKLAETAKFVLDDGIASLEAKRTVTYLSLLSTEITLKEFLEQAGVRTKVIRKNGHKLSGLLKDICSCEIEVEIAPKLKAFVSAARLLPIDISCKGAKTPIGRIIDAESEGASVYPNEIRYGEHYSQFPPEVLTGMVNVVAAFATLYWGSVRLKRPENANRDGVIARPPARPS
jgi:hypothetical protein